MADRRPAGGTPTVGPTKPATVAWAALAGAGASWLALEVVRFAGGALPLPGPGAWLSVLVLASATGWLAWRTRDALRRRERVEAGVAVIRLRIAKAGMLGAAVLGGAYLVFAVMAYGGWPAPLAQSRLVGAILAVIACVAWGFSGWALQRACRIPGDPEEPSGD